MGEGTIVFELTVPTEWPPSGELIVFCGRIDGAKLRVTVRPDARMHFQCFQDATAFETTTPKLDMPDFANLKVAFSWGGGDTAQVAINGISLTREALDLGERVQISSRDRVATGLREKLIVQVPQKLNIEEERLIRSLMELQERIVHADRVHLLEASAILRRLLLDAHPLAHTVNRAYQCKLQFPVVPEKSEENAPEGSTYTYINLSPLFATRDAVTLASWDQFLSLATVKGEGVTFSVREVIDVCANTKGGIHFDKPKSEAASGLLGLDEKFHPALVDSSLHALADLSWCVIQGLKPLVSGILTKRSE